MYTTHIEPARSSGVSTALISGVASLSVLALVVLTSAPAVAKKERPKMPQVSLATLGLEGNQHFTKWKGKPAVVRFSSEGCIAEAKIHRVLGRVKSQVIHCYGRFGPKNTRVAPKITVDIGINSDGSAFQISTSADTRAAKEVAACVERIIKRMRFPRCATDEDTFSVWTYEYQSAKTAAR